jgi:hypothetical protein
VGIHGRPKDLPEPHFGRPKDLPELFESSARPLGQPWVSTVVLRTYRNPILVVLRTYRNFASTCLSSGILMISERYFRNGRPKDIPGPVLP